MLAPGADPGQIALRVRRRRARWRSTRAATSSLHTAAGELRQPRPVVYQDIDGVRRPVAGDYVVDGDGRVRIRLGAYDASRPLVIDPVLAYSTYLGGSNDEGDGLYGAVVGIAVDAAGNAYVTGTTTLRRLSRPRPAPTARSAATRTRSSTKLSPTGAVVYSTYLGGPCDDIANAHRGRRRRQRLHHRPGARRGLLLRLSTPGVARRQARSYGRRAVLPRLRRRHGRHVDRAGDRGRRGRPRVRHRADRASTGDFPTTAGAYRTAVLPGYLRRSATPTASWRRSSPPAPRSCTRRSSAATARLADRASRSTRRATSTSRAARARTTSRPSTRCSRRRHRSARHQTGFVAKLSPRRLAPRLLHVSRRVDQGRRSRALAVDGAGQRVRDRRDRSPTDFPTTPGVLQPHRGNLFCSRRASAPTRS